MTVAAVTVTSLSLRARVTHGAFPVSAGPSWSHHCCSAGAWKKTEIIYCGRLVCSEPGWERPWPPPPSAPAAGTGLFSPPRGRPDRLTHSSGRRWGREGNGYSPCQCLGVNTVSPGAPVPFPAPGAPWARPLPSKSHNRALLAQVRLRPGSCGSSGLEGAGRRAGQRRGRCCLCRSRRWLTGARQTSE